MTNTTTDSSTEDSVSENNEAIASAMKAIKHALNTDEGYLITWYANLTMCAVDSGVPRTKAMESAMRFIQLLVGVDINVYKWYQQELLDATLSENENYVKILGINFNGSEFDENPFDGSPDAVALLAAKLESKQLKIEWDGTTNYAKWNVGGEIYNPGDYLLVTAETIMGIRAIA